MKKLIGADKGAESVNYANEHISKYTNQLGAVSSDPNLLIDETEPTIQYAKNFARELIRKNLQYKNDNGDAYVANWCKN